MQPLSQAVLLEAFPPQDRGKAMGFWGLGIVVAPILGPGARRLADRQLQLALGVLHQHSGRHRVARHDEAVHLRSAVPAAASRARSTTGASACWRSASARCRSCSTRARRTTGSRRTSSRCWRSSARSTLDRAHRPRADDRRPDRRSARVQGAQLRGRRVPDDGVGFVLYGSLVLLPIMLQTLLGYPPLQAGIAMAPRGIGSFFMMPITGLMTGRFDRAQAARRRAWSAAAHADLAVAAQPAGRLLGHLLAAVHPGRRACRCCSCR